jgi:hypothetical protein
MCGAGWAVWLAMREGTVFDACDTGGAGRGGFAIRRSDEDAREEVDVDCGLSDRGASCRVVKPLCSFEGGTIRGVPSETESSEEIGSGDPDGAGFASNGFGSSGLGSPHMEGLRLGNGLELDFDGRFFCNYKSFRG